MSLPESWAADWYKWLDEDKKLETVSIRQNIEKLEGELKEIDIKLNKLLDGYLEGIIDPEIYELPRLKPWYPQATPSASSNRSIHPRLKSWFS